jgi:O-antigen ligase
LGFPLSDLRAWLGEHLSSIRALPPRLSAATVFYVLHLLLQGKIALSELMAFWAIFYLLWAMVREGVRPSFHILYYPLALYGLVSTVSAFVAPVRIHGAGEAMLWFKMLIFPTALILYRRLPPLRRLAIGAYALFSIGIAVWGLFEFVVLDQRDLDHRITGPSTHVMTFSGLLLPLSLMLLLLWWYERRGWQIVGTVVVSLALLLTFTRSVWLGWAAAFVAIVLLTRMRMRVWIWVAPAILIFITFMPMNLFSRLMSTFDTRQSSNFDRIRMVEAGVEMIKDFPVLGVGPANVKEMYTLYRKPDAPRPRPPHLHNNVIQLWAERGILGLAAYVLLLTLFLRACARAWQGQARMWSAIGVATVVSLTVAGLFEFNFGDTEVFYLMLNLFALVLASIEGDGEGAGTGVPNEPAPSLVPAPA